ncbi:MAG: hypothetical protein QM703_22660 [Gemmatales bacterium]
MNHEVASLYLQTFSPGDSNWKRQFGVWGMMSKALHSVEWMYGRHAALQILHECEKMAVLDYEQSLRDNGIPFRSRTIIVTLLIPQGCTHIKQLENMIASSTQRITDFNLDLDRTFKPERRSGIQKEKERNQIIVVR